LIMFWEQKGLRYAKASSSRLQTADNT
jgi:hypothetical protein